MNNKTNSPIKVAFVLLALSALGIVYGDIGTSPLYALQETFFSHHYTLERSFENIAGALSLFFWSLAIVITLKYVLLIMRADNHGEGGIFALLALLRQNQARVPKRALAVITPCMIIGAALLYGDGIITPAISVLSAVEGLGVASGVTTEYLGIAVLVLTAAYVAWLSKNIFTRILGAVIGLGIGHWFAKLPSVNDAVIPLTLLILFALFFIQRKGTERVGKLFGPIMACWFVVLALLAIPQIWRHPEVWYALNPMHALQFLAHHGWRSFWILGAVVLCVTGGEALYADMGHFGRRAITSAWLCVVYPALVLNYFGQGARLLDPAPIAGNKLFYALVPHFALIPVVILATAATVIASQALISGCFSLTQQAMALGVINRMKIVHTNPDMAGQIYLPFVNWILCAGCMTLVVLFRNAGALAAAYGIAVTGTMAITTAAFYLIARHGWGWRREFIAPVCGLLIAVDLAFFSANALKFFQGGFVPVLVALFLFAIMVNWQWGQELLHRAHAAYAGYRTVSWLVAKKSELVQCGGILHGRRNLVENDRAFVFLSSRPVRTLNDPVPIVVRTYTKRHGSLPKHLTILHIAQKKIPYVAPENRYEIIEFGKKEQGNHVVSLIVHFGFMENPDVRKILRDVRQKFHPDVHRCAIEVGRDRLIIDEDTPSWIRVRARAFRAFLRYSIPAYEYFGLAAEAGEDETAISVEVGKVGVHVKIPELALGGEEEELEIDPDTLQATELQPVPFA